MVDSSHKWDYIWKFILNYHINKALRGNGFAEKQREAWTLRPLSVLITFVVGVVLAVFFHNPLLLLIPVFLVWLFPLIFPINPLDLFRRDKSIEEIGTIHEKITEAYAITEDQFQQLRLIDLTGEEEQALFELAIFGPIHGKEAVKRNLPIILSIGRLSELEFVQELADDLHIRR